MVAAVLAVALLAGCQADGGDGAQAADWKTPAASASASAGEAPPAAGSASKADVCAKAKRAMDEGKAEVFGLVLAAEGESPDLKAVGAALAKTGEGLRAAAADADAELKSTIEKVASGFETAAKASDPVAETEKTIPPLEELFKDTCG